MSHFQCDKCGIAQIDSPIGYIAGCCHYPPENGREVLLMFGGDGSLDRKGFYSRSRSAFFYSRESMRRGLAVHPVQWRDLEKIE